MTSTRCPQWIPTAMLLLLVSWQWNLLAWSSIVIGIGGTESMSPFSVTDCSIKPQIPLPENQQQQLCDWDPLAAQSRCHHSPLLPAQPSQQIPLPGNQQQQQSMESVGLIK